MASSKGPLWSPIQRPCPGLLVTSNQVIKFGHFEKPGTFQGEFGDSFQGLGLPRTFKKPRDVGAASPWTCIRPSQAFSGDVRRGSVQ